MEHYTFFMRKQEFSEPFDKFYANLRNLVKSCNVGETENKLFWVSATKIFNQIYYDKI